MSDDIVAELDRWLVGEKPYDHYADCVMVRRARDEIVALRDDLTMARADWNNEIENRKHARAEMRERCAQLIRGGKTGGSSEYARGWDDACEGHAAAIRNRGDEP